MIVTTKLIYKLFTLEAILIFRINNVFVGKKRVTKKPEMGGGGKNSIFTLQRRIEDED